MDAQNYHCHFSVNNTAREAFTSITHVGGRYTVVVARPDGHIYPASGTFLTIEAPHRLVHTRKYEWDHPTLGQRETTIAYRFDPWGQVRV